MLPVIVIVGRPNVGKSTLFNCLTKTRDALVADLPGITRDRIYGEGRVGDRPTIVVDTGGLVADAASLDEMMAKQVWQAVEEATVVLLLVDGRAGLTHADREILARLRKTNRPVQLVVNKTDGIDTEVALGEFYQLGIGDPIPIAAAHGRGLERLMECLLSRFEEVVPSIENFSLETGIKLAIVGRPNVGKSTLVNRILGEDRVVVFDMPGTTRDSIFIPMERHGERYTLIDTAGVRRKRSIQEVIEKFSVIKTLNAIEVADVVVLLIDGTENVTDQDLHLLGQILKADRAMVIAVNKWDGLPEDQRQLIKKELDRRLQFLDFARIHFISALHGSGVGDLFTSVKEAYHAARRDVSSTELTSILEKAVASHQPPLVKGRRIKLRYAHLGGHDPFTIIIHGNQTELLPDSYKRYLIGYFRRTLKLMGSPIQIITKTAENPYASRKNELTDRQIKSKKRLMKHVKQKRRASDS